MRRPGVRARNHPLVCRCLAREIDPNAMWLCHDRRVMKRIAVGLGLALLVVAPWPIVAWYAWANNAYPSGGGWSTDWSSLESVLVPVFVVVGIAIGVCLAVSSLRPYVRGWRVVPTSWILAFGAVCWVSVTTAGF